MIAISTASAGRVLNGLVVARKNQTSQARRNRTVALSATDDILVRAGVLIDDNLSVIASHDGSRAVFGNEAPRTEIEITEVCGEQ